MDNGRSDGSAERVRCTRRVAVVRQEEILVLQQPIIALVPALLEFQAAGRQVRIYFFGEGDDRQRLQELAGAFGRRVEVLDTSASVLDFAAAIKNLDYLITSDSLALHLAIAQGIPNLSFYAPTSAAEIDTFGTGVKLCSTSTDYCSYRKDADNSTLTAVRLIEAFRNHRVRDKSESDRWQTRGSAFNMQVRS